MGSWGDKGGWGLLRRWAWVLLLAAWFPLSLAPAPAWAGEVLQASSSNVDGLFSLVLEMRIQGSAETVRGLLSDYNRVSSYNDSIIESRLLSVHKDGSRTARLVAHDCIALFCATLVQVQRMVRLPNGDLRVDILPEQSDYAKGRSLWTIQQEPNGFTRVRVEAEMAPKLWLPPVVGPALLTRLMMDRAVEMVGRLESLGRQSAALTDLERPS
ncbi:MAG: hypothetical protein HQL51_13505 [Magnetococcales bacterium]|nr:hypothetical protein [Magnetococcales bacterium]